MSAMSSSSAQAPETCLSCFSCSSFSTALSFPLSRTRTASPSSISSCAGTGSSDPRLASIRAGEIPASTKLAVIWIGNSYAFASAATAEAATVVGWLGCLCASVAAVGAGVIGTIRVVSA